ncbi:MAG: polysaccharide deacetylase family protein [Armatimonadetes bacterium]|nr:polysaccharide deacetylase family protein [Armatimonadota bacterium]
MPMVAMMLLGLALMSPMVETPTITPFAHGKSCAFSMEFDDSMGSQVQNLLPLLAQYRFPATFYVNPGEERYRQHQEVWEKKVLAAGNELGDHTMHHRDTVGAEQGASEIGDAAKILHKLVGHDALMPFAIPGGVKWEIPKADFDRILAENRLFLPGREAFYQDGQGDITKWAKMALDSSSWHHLGFHGVGGEWLSTSVANMKTLLEFLDQHRDKMWVAPTGVVWKYQREREAFLGLDAKGKPRFDHEKLVPFDGYDVPLTMHYPVPAGWKKAKVIIDGGSPMTLEVTDGAVHFDFLPRASSIRVEHVQN